MIAYIIHDSPWLCALRKCGLEFSRPAYASVADAMACVTQWELLPSPLLIIPVPWSPLLVTYGL